MIKDLRYFFNEGYNRLTVGNEKSCRKELTEEVFSGSSSSFSVALKKGLRNISKPRYDAITSIFSKYGVEEMDVWKTVEE